MENHFFRKFFFCALLISWAAFSAPTARAWVQCSNAEMLQVASVATPPTLGTCDATYWWVSFPGGSTVAYVPVAGGCSPNPGDPKAAGYCDINSSYTGGSWPNGVNCSGSNCVNPLVSASPSMGGSSPYKAPYHITSSLVPTTDASRCVARLSRDCAVAGTTYDWCDLGGTPQVGAHGLCTCSHDASCSGGVAGNPCYNTGSPAPSPTPAPAGTNCKAGALPNNPGQWKKHACGAGTGHCADSMIPVPAPGGVTSFDSLANPMAACCGLGWGEDAAGASKLDCVEAYIGSPPTSQTFRSFYLAGSAKDPLTTADLVYPNQMFVLDKSGVPVNGFYNQDGTRCNFRDAATKTAKNLSIAQQMDIYATSLTNLTLPTGGQYNTDVDPYCCTLVVFALERMCPTNDTLGSPAVNVATTDSGTRRCIAAKQMKLDYGVYDLCDPSLVKRARFRVATSFNGENPQNATITVNDSINVQSLISQFYPPTVVGAPPVCPVTPAVYTRPWTAGQCRLDPAENFP